MSSDKSTPPEDRAYYANGLDEYVCWECASPEEREDPAPDGEAVEEQCARCPTTWEYADAS